jgi:hypothetical protein
MRFSLEEMAGFLNGSAQVGNLYNIAIKIGFSVDFPDYQIQNLAAYLEKAGINDLCEVGDIIRDEEQALVDFLAKVRATNPLTWRVSAAFVCELVLVRQFYPKFDFEFLIANGFDNDHANVILGVLFDLKAQDVEKVEDERNS